jgi:hypothetical protein
MFALVVSLLFFHLPIHNPNSIHTSNDYSLLKTLAPSERYMLFGTTGRISKVSLVYANVPTDLLTIDNGIIPDITYKN